MGFYYKNRNPRTYIYPKTPFKKKDLKAITKWKRYLKNSGQFQSQ